MWHSKHRAAAFVRASRQWKCHTIGIATQRPVNRRNVGRQWSGPRAIRQIVNNQAVLDALVKLTGENFGFDKERWILWIQEKERKQPNP